MSRARRRLRLRVVFGALLSGVLTTAFFQPLWAQDVIAKVQVAGTGSAQLASQIVAWQNALIRSLQPVDMEYIARGSEQGKASLLRGGSDFIVSGEPFTDAELATKPAGAGKLISVPIASAALSVIFSGTTWETSHSLGPQCEEDAIEAGLDPVAECITFGVWPGPFRVPPNSLAALTLGIGPSFAGNGYAAWSSAGWKDAIGTSELRIGSFGIGVHTWVNRTEGSAANKSLLEYAEAMSPTVWDLATTQWLPDDPTNPFDYQWEPVQDRFPAPTLTRFGSDTQIGLMAVYLDPRTGLTPSDWTGNAGAVPATQLGDIMALYPNYFTEFEIQNANGDWVLPTTDSISKALAAGSGMNVAATQPVPGAYPLVWVNRLYTFAGTLAPDQANAMAAAVRYIVTDGQAEVVADDGAALTPALVDEALTAADEIVAGNCPTATHRVIEGGRSDFELDTPGINAIGPMLHCEQLPPPTTTTTTSTTTTVPPSTTTAAPTSTTTSTALATTTTRATAAPSVAGSSRPSSGTPAPVVATTQPSLTSAPAVPDDTTTTTVAASTPPPTTVESDADAGASDDEEPRLGQSLSGLPLPLPGDGSAGFKKFGTFVLGAVLYLVGRRVVGRVHLPT